jgi:hypothetical protein
MPSATPTATPVPTPAPTEYPTSAGQETTEAIAFTVSQPMTGITAAAFTANEDNEAVFIEATARVLGVSEADITNVQAEDARRRRRRLSASSSRGSRRLSGSITITYDVVLEVADGEDSTDVYSAAVDVIVDSASASCSSSCLATIIAEVAAANGVSSAELTSATVTAVSSSAVGDARTVTIPAPTAAPNAAPTDDSRSIGDLSTGAVIGIAIVLAMCLILPAGAYIGINSRAPAKTGKVAPLLPLSASAGQAEAREKGAGMETVTDEHGHGGDGSTEDCTRPAAPVLLEVEGSVNANEEATAIMGTASSGREPPLVARDIRGTHTKVAPGPADDTDED